MTTRRDVMKILSAAGAATGAVGLASAQTAVGGPPSASGSVRIASTWDFGVAANAAGHARLQGGGGLLDAIEAAGRVTEANPTIHTVGLGGYPDRDGHVTLDAAIMDDQGGLGAVAALEDTIHAISVARRVMERTPHVLLAGQGATLFARQQGFPVERLLTPDVEKAWRTWLATARYQPVANIENASPKDLPGGARNHDTLGVLACDGAGRLAAGVTTSGMAFKMRGRVGDSPLAGCGLFVEPGVGAATSSGVGEEVIRIAGSARVTGSIRAGMAPAAACEEAVRHIARLRGAAAHGEQVGFLALTARGEVGAFALVPGFSYAATDAEGRTVLRQAPSLFAA